MIQEKTLAEELRAMRQSAGLRCKIAENGVAIEEADLEVCLSDAKKEESELAPIGRLPFMRRFGITAGNGEDLHEWLIRTESSPDLIYRRAGLEQVLLLRDQIGRLFSWWTRSQDIAAPPVPQTEYSRGKWLCCPPTVVGQHLSKSVALPVVHYNLGRAELIVRGNFHDWKASLRSDTPVPVHPIFGRQRAISTCYCEGFKREWVQGPPAENPCEYTIELLNDHDLYCWVKMVLFTLYPG